MSAQLPRTLSDWSNIAQIVSGFAVIVTLVVLILGVRENTEVVRLAAYADNQNSFNELQLAILENPDSLRVFTAYMSGDTADLRELDGMRLNSVVAVIFRSLETAYFSERSGLLGEAEWRRLDRNTCANFMRARATGREAILDGFLSVEFMEHLTTTCSKAETPTLAPVTQPRPQHPETE